eukprot:COSAG02_NODE_748_length_17708_cov_8.490317_1_plen_102_part_00
MGECGREYGFWGGGGGWEFGGGGGGEVVRNWGGGTVGGLYMGVVTVGLRDLEAGLRGNRCVFGRRITGRMTQYMVAEKCSRAASITCSAHRRLRELREIVW